MRVFSEQRELIQWARREIEDKVQTLEKDVRHCLLQKSQHTPDAPAPFPALLFCFAVVDLLGALYSGSAASNAPTAPQSREYMQRFMDYTSEQSELLQLLFRHKLVHLAQPKPVIKYKGEHITWHEWHDNPEKHLKKDKLPEKTEIAVTAVLSVKCEYEFHVSIMEFVRDIKNSIEKPSGYLNSLETSPDLQDKFEQAILQIYGCK